MPVGWEGKGSVSVTVRTVRECNAGRRRRAAHQEEQIVSEYNRAGWEEAVCVCVCVPARGWPASEKGQANTRRGTCLRGQAKWCAGRSKETGRRCVVTHGGRGGGGRGERRIEVETMHV